MVEEVQAALCFCEQLKKILLYLLPELFLFSGVSQDCLQLFLVLFAAEETLGGLHGG